MKKLGLITSATILLTLVLSSCQKDYTCTCTYDDGKNTGEAVYTLKDKKKDVAARCDAYEVAVNSTTTWECEVK